MHWHSAICYAVSPRSATARAREPRRSLPLRGGWPATGGPGGVRAAGRSCCVQRCRDDPLWRFAPSPPQGGDGSSYARDALDHRAAAGQLFLEPLEAAVEMVDAVDRRLAFRGQPGDHQRHRSAQIGRHDGRALELRHALDDRRLAGQVDVGAEPGQFLHVHEAVLENRLGDLRLALGHGHQAHELRLQIGREAREGFGRDVDRGDAAAVAADADAGIDVWISAPVRRITSSAVSSSSARAPSRITSPPAMATAIA